jgi:hypothetical protein
MKRIVYILVPIIAIGLIFILLLNKTNNNQNVKELGDNAEQEMFDSGWFQYQVDKGWQKISFDVNNNNPLNVIDANTLSVSIGKWVRIEGISQSLKNGATIAGHDYRVWIEELDLWPRNIEDQKVQAVGILDERYDLPVFISDPNLLIQGIIVPEGTDLHKASHRFVIQNVIISLMP